MLAKLKMYSAPNKANLLEKLDRIVKEQGIDIANPAEGSSTLPAKPAGPAK